MAGNAEEISPIGFDVMAVDDAIAAKNWLLRFPPKLEAIFERDTGSQRCRELIVRAYIGIVIYDLFAVADWWATPELFWTALWMRVAFFTPVSLLLTATLYAYPGTFLRESIMCIGGGAIATGTIIYLMAVSRNAPQATLHESMTLVVLFLTVVQRIRFSYLAPTCLAFLAAHVFALAHFYNYSFGQQVAINMVFGGTVIFALIASYTMERDLRLHYLLSLRDRMRNLELDWMSRRDALTGLGNRRSLEETLAACEEAERLRPAFHRAVRYRPFQTVQRHWGPPGRRSLPHAYRRHRPGGAARPSGLCLPFRWRGARRRAAKDRVP